MRKIENLLVYLLVFVGQSASGYNGVGYQQMVLQRRAYETIIFCFADELRARPRPRCSFDGNYEILLDFHT